MTLGLIIGLLMMGLFLVLIEIFIVPGIMKVGIFGLILITAGVILAFYYDEQIGWYSFFGAIISGALLTIIALRAKTWERVALNTTIDSTIHKNKNITVGDQGITVSRLAPMGKVKFGEDIFEAKTNGKLIDEHSKVEITKITGHSVFVKLL